MPRSRRKSRSKKSSKTHQQSSYKDVYTSPYERPITAGDALATNMIPQFRAQIAQRYSFRFKLTAGIALATPFTTTMLLDLYAISVGATLNPVRIFNNIKLIGIKLWQPTNQLEAPWTTSYIAIEFSPSTTAGFGGAPRIPYVAEVTSTSKYAHLAVRPKRTELASQWFSAQQGNYVLWNMQTGPGCVMQIDFLATNVNGETPVANAYTSSLAKGVVGVTNFGVPGVRSDGLVDLVSP